MKRDDEEMSPFGGVKRNSTDDVKKARPTMQRLNASPQHRTHHPMKRHPIRFAGGNTHLHCVQAVEAQVVHKVRRRGHLCRLDLLKVLNDIDDALANLLAVKERLREITRASTEGRVRWYLVPRRPAGEGRTLAESAQTRLT